MRCFIYVIIHDKCLSSNTSCTALMYLYLYKLTFLISFLLFLKHILLLCVLVVQSCLTLCDPVDCSPSMDSSVHGILQTILEWIAIPFFRRSFQPRDQTQISHTAGSFLFYLNHQGSPIASLSNFYYLYMFLF